MSGQMRTMAQSLVLHAAVVSLVFAGSWFIKPESRPMVIDLSLEEPCAKLEGTNAPQPYVPEKMEERIPAAAPPVQGVQQPPAPVRGKVVDVPAEMLPSPDAVPAPVAVAAPSAPVLTAAPARMRETSSDAGARGAQPPVQGQRSGVPTAGSCGARTSESARDDYLKANFTYIRDLILKCMVYPPVARKMGWEGKVTVSFVVSRDGSVREVKVARTSGRELLDRNAAETVVKASPFPPPPAEAELLIPILYKLN